MVMSLAADKSGEDKCLMHNDVSRAYFHAEAVRDVFVDMVREDTEEGDGAKFGWLKLSTYGTRDAASNWELKYAKVLTNMNFQKGRADPCVFKNEKNDIVATVHGDAFFSCGSLESLRWMQREMEKELALKSIIIGGKRSLRKELVVLGRTVTYTEYGIKYEADKKHAKQLLEDMNMQHVKAAVARGCKVKKNDEDEEGRGHIAANCPTNVMSLEDLNAHLHEEAAWMILEEPEDEEVFQLVMSKSEKKLKKQESKVNKCCEKHVAQLNVVEEVQGKLVWISAGIDSCAETQPYLLTCSLKFLRRRRTRLARSSRARTAARSRMRARKSSKSSRTKARGRASGRRERR